MRLNHITAKREMRAQRWTTTRMVDELEECGVRVHRTVMSSYLSGSRACTDAAVIVGLAQVLNVNPYGLLAPEDPKTAVLELCAVLGVSADELAALEDDRHDELLAIEGT